MTILIHRFVRSYRYYTLLGRGVLFWGVVLSHVISEEAFADRHVPYQQHEIEFAMLFQVLNFVEWPERTLSKENEFVSIGVCGTDELLATIRAMISENNSTGSRSFKIVELGDEMDPEVLAALSVVYIEHTDDSHCREMLDWCQQYPILTASSHDDFLLQGGILNFVNNSGRVSFEINLKQSQEREIMFRAQLLRLARRVIK